MANYSSTNDLKKGALHRAGELTGGGSDFDTKALEYLNRVYHSILSGANEFGVDLGEPFRWAKYKNPSHIILKAPYETGTISVTAASRSATLSSAPSYSIEGYYLKIDNRPDFYRVMSHTAASTALVLDAPYADVTGSGLTFKAHKLDYDLVSSSYKSGTITGISAANPSVITSSSHGLSTGDLVTISSSNSTPSVDGVYEVTVINSNTFSVPVSVTGSGTSGSWGITGVIRLVQPMRVYRSQGDESDNEGKIYGVGLDQLTRDWPLHLLERGTPSYFAVKYEDDKGVVGIQVNKSVDEDTKVEFDFIPTYPDLIDSTNSIPKLPKQWRVALEYGATYFLMADKSDQRASEYYALTAKTLQAMVDSSYEEDIAINNKNRGRLVPRLDLSVMGKRYISQETDVD